MTHPDPRADEAMDRYLDAVRQNEQAVAERRTPPFGAGALEVLARRAGLDPVTADAAEKRERRARARARSTEEST